MAQLTPQRERRVSLEREGRGTHELQLDQVTVENLRRLFQVNPTEAWLRDEVDGTAYFPQADGNFHLEEARLPPYATLMVEGSIMPRSNLPRSNTYGTALTSTPPPHSLSPNLNTPTSSNPVYSSAFRSVQAAKKAPTFTLKIIKSMHMMTTSGKKPEFLSQQQTFIEINESTANVEHILGVVRGRWGQGYILVTQDGLTLEESPATQGLTFWKCPRRKIYAVPTDSDEGPSLGPPRQKQQLLLDDICTMKDDIQLIKNFTRDATTKLPLALQVAMQEAFRCTICHSVPIREPIMVAKCCKSIIGCEECTDKWYSGDNGLTKRCPLCRADRGFAEIMRLNGLAGFLQAMSDVFSRASNQPPLQSDMDADVLATVSDDGTTETM